VQEVIYDIPLGSACVYLVEDNDLNLVIQKVIIKAMLMESDMQRKACTECVIHSMMNHPKIVKLYEYTENDFGIYLHMEYCNDPNFFESRLEATINPF
jgi:serine/threonine protein kinase